MSECYRAWFRFRLFMNIKIACRIKTIEYVNQIEPNYALIQFLLTNIELFLLVCIFVSFWMTKLISGYMD